ncbi:hypothetical protein [Alkalimonas amylolytica]|uniref:PAS fold-containing protein n=1 Tax=Alkalimonas amylolytica TaxID=152573 RepID=A0A1H3Z8B2_ALKAM|nr:hypothetical protein [Alkalimonas amylolytica]SEA20053.1 hypothetical protein SAMN04488051_10273 [Alkalimonas amylolytica]
MSNDSIVRYRIDAEDNISFVDEGWFRFAEENDGTELMRPELLGQSLWDSITDPETCQIYQKIVSRVRQGKLARFNLRCDGPENRRWLEMKISAAPDGSVEFESRTIRVEDREPMALLSRKVPRSTDLLRICAWCNRMDVGFGFNDWIEVEDATQRLQLFELERLPQLTHGICEDCLESMTDTMDEMDA